jgi:uncharacterized protein (TIGR02594 family)
MPNDFIPETMRRIGALVRPVGDTLSNFIAPEAQASPEVAKAARKYLGKGEVGANNAGPFVESLGGKPGDPWCSYFVSRVAKDVGEDVWGRLPSALSWYKNAQKSGMTVETPQMGDIMVFTRGKKGSGKGHVGIIDSVTDDTITTIEGNVGSYPATVKRITYNRNNIPNFVGFVRTPAQKQ